MKINKIILSIITLSLFSITGFSLYLYLSTRLLSEGHLSFSELNDTVHIYRDDNGIPHIYAEKSDNDAFFALGFVHAQDRFWQMEFQRRIASGRLSELFGSNTVEMDKYLRTYGFYHAAESAWDSYDARTKKIIECYTAGVNAFIKLNQFPLEITILHYKPEPWSVIDSIAWQKMMAWNLQKHSWMNKLDYALIKNKMGSTIAIETYFPDYPNGSPVIYSRSNHATFAKKKTKTSFSLMSLSKPEPALPQPFSVNEIPGKGSNGWVVSGTLTKDHHAILANDVHLELTAPSLWYLVELRGPDLHVTGATIPGLPAIAIGHNEQIAWGVTSGYNDAAELYILNKNSPLKIRHEDILVRNAQTIHLTIKDSEQGPIINSVTPQLKSTVTPIALHWPALMAGDTTVQSFLKLNYAQNWQAFQNALKDFVTPTQNFLFADTKGNIGYYYPGRLFIKNHATFTPVPVKQAYLLKAYIPFSELPHLFNPSSGYIATANNKVADDHYPYILNARWPVPPYRIERIIQLLQQQMPLTMATMVDIQADVQSQFWLQIKPFLLSVQPKDTLSVIGLNLLSHWSGKMDVNSRAATVFAYWINNLISLTPEVIRHADKTIEPLYLYQSLKKGLPAHYLQLSLQQTMTTLTRHLGHNPDRWTWGSIHQATFMGDGLGKSPLLGWIWNRQLAAPGGQYTVNAGRYHPETFQQIQGATYRQIINVGNLDKSMYIIPMGQSGNPLSRHYDDFNQKWRNMAYVTIPATLPCKLNSKHCLILERK